MPSGIFVESGPGVHFEMSKATHFFFVGLVLKVKKCYIADTLEKSTKEW